jgi:hypothetical protein
VSVFPSQTFPSQGPRARAGRAASPRRTCRGPVPDGPLAAAWTAVDMAEPERTALLTTAAGKYYNQFVWKVSELIGQSGGQPLFAA